MKKLTVALMAIFIAVFGIYGCSGQQEQPQENKPTEMVEPEQATAPETANPLTGDLDFDAKAVGKRPVAIVVENNEDARPQWNMDSPDIIVEGEIEEAGEGTDSRMLWLYADYTKLPDKIGPMRSARPPFIKFSELFDSIFIHWGMSHSKGEYVGANTVFKKDNVDHINQMEYKGKSSTELFGRDSSRNVALEHTAYCKGGEVPEAIEKTYKFRTDINEDSFTRLPFKLESEPMSDTACKKVKLKLTKKLSHNTTWKYNEKDGQYHSKDYEQDVSVDNVIVLFGKSKYVEKENYMGAGSFNRYSTKSELYSDFNLTKGGKAYIISKGTVLEGTWNTDNGKLSVLDDEKAAVALNPGRSWIALASSNKGGKIKLS